MLTSRLPPSRSGSLAQLAEHLTFNQGVEGSIPSRPTKSVAPSSNLVRTLAFQAGNTGSNPVGATTLDVLDNAVLIRAGIELEQHRFVFLGGYALH